MFVRSIERINSGFLSQGDVLDEVRTLNIDVERSRPSSFSQQRTELFLVMRLSHENVSSSKPAADFTTQFHGDATNASFLRCVVKAGFKDEHAQPKGT